MEKQFQGQSSTVGLLPVGTSAEQHKALILLFQIIHSSSSPDEKHWRDGSSFTLR